MQAVQEAVKSRPKTSALYAVFIVSCLYVYRGLWQPRANAQWDWVLTLSAGLQCLAFAMLVLDTRSQVAEGLSEITLWAFFIAHVTRLSTTFWGKGYVPEDSTADVYLYQMLEVVSVCLLALKLLGMTTVRTMHDVGQGMERWSGLIAMVVVSIVLGWLCKSTGHSDVMADFSWMFSMWLDALALGPQVQLLMKATQVDESAVHFASTTLASNLVFAAFWAQNAQDHYESLTRNGYHMFLYGIICAAGIRLVLCLAYFYLFAKTSQVFKIGKKNEYELCAQEDEEL